MKNKFFYGQSLVELLIVVGLAALLLPAILTAFVVTREGRPQVQQRTEALGWQKEALEAVRAIRDEDWNLVATNGTYHPVLSSNKWQLESGSETFDGFTRRVIIADAFRDTTGKIVQTGGSVDPSTKDIAVQISWNTPRFSLVEERMFITRYRDNLAYIQTTKSDFDTGDFVGTNAVNNSGGEVVLGSGGKASWCGPTLTIAALDLPKNGVANALTAIEGKAFAGTGENASGVSYASINISNANPPASSVVGTVDGYKTNEVFGENDYAYFTTDTNTSEVIIINLTNHSVVGSFNSPGSSDGESIYVSGPVGYMTSGSDLYTFDLSSKSGSRTQLGSVSLAGTGTRVIVKGNYAFVSISGNTGTELQIVNVANPSNLSVIGQANTDSTGATDLFVNDTATRAYLVTSSSTTQKELFIIDTAIKTGNRSILGSYEDNGMSAKGVTVVPGNFAIIVGTGGEEYQVINIANETSPVRCGGLEIDTGVNGVASVLESDGDAYSYIITGDATSEFKIIEGGPGGQFATSGTYTSQAFDAGWQTAFNRLEFTATKPNQTNLQVQVAVADPVNNSCTGANYQFVGPDGTSSSFFTSNGVVPFDNDSAGYENPGRCMKYQVYFSTQESTSTPIYESITINYSP